jgi:hypothetical protein
MIINLDKQSSEQVDMGAVNRLIILIYLGQSTDMGICHKLL